MIKFFVSLMAADQLNIEHEIKKFEVHCDGFHLDVMDNHFVPNLSFNFTAVNQIAQITNKPVMVHLMIEKPEAIIDRFYLRKNSIVAFHSDSTKNPELVIEKIRAKEWSPCIAVSPKVGIEKIMGLLHLVDQVLIMSVEPGFSGQEFIPEVAAKVENLNMLKQAKQLPITIAMDGGIDTTNILDLVHKGATHFGVGSALFDTDDPITALAQFYDLVEGR